MTDKEKQEKLAKARKWLEEQATADKPSVIAYFSTTKGKMLGYTQYTRQKEGYWTKTSSSGGGGIGTLVATGTEEPDDEIKALGDRLSQLSLAQWTSLLTYLHIMYGVNFKVFF